MCAIFGSTGEIDIEVAMRLRDRMAHRGPDAAGLWQDPESGIWLGHRRLAIVDLSEAGAQPMHSRSGRYVLTYNGEIFNHNELRLELQSLGHVFVGQSDTEVVLAGCEAWGLLDTLHRLIGFFAIGLWDRKQRVFTLVRDRFGIKPAYWAKGAGGRFAFASELWALEALPWVDRSPNADGLACFFRYLAISPPATIYRGVHQLPPGHFLTASAEGVKVETWWSVDDMVARGRSDPFDGTEEEAVSALDELLADAVRRRMNADVPVGAFLSGGVDSSLVVALMRATGSNVRTFTIGFDVASHNESEHAEAIATHLGCQHTTHQITAADAIDLAPRLSDLHDQPFADVSSLPTYLLSVSTRRDVTVALSGDGGDELFGGYPRYFWADRISATRARLGAMAPLAGRVLKSIPDAIINGPVNALTQHRYAGSEGLAHRVSRVADYLSIPREEVYSKIVSVWDAPESLISDDLACTISSHLGPKPQRFAHLPWSEQMMATDQTSFLADDILAKVDRMSMSVALEVRVPLLDHRVAEFSWRLPTAWKLSSSGDRGKLILRRVLDRYVPRELIERPKSGFGVPLASWLRGPLKNWAGDIIGTARADGTLDADLVEATFASHQAGVDRASRLWSVLMYLQWRLRTRERRTWN